MAMHAYLTAFSNTHVKDVHDSHHVLKSSTRHIFPTFVETVYPVFVEVFRNVTETHVRYDPISTVRMLSRFL